VVICGHTHMPFDRMVGQTRVLNTGSVGMSYGHSEADWLILGPGVEFRRTRYDVGEAVERIRASGCPCAERLFVEGILHPPDEAVMTDTYDKAALAL
jgi:diadenosine tetraphosphatase ApaH/serine/threonine PP2A family protein phosphatase